MSDTLLRLAESSAYRPSWSADVLEELRRNVVGRGIPADRVDRRIGLMTRSFPDALVTGCESLIEGMTNDTKDRHVLAAAVRANAEVLPTSVPGVLMLLERTRCSEVRRGSATAHPIRTHEPGAGSGGRRGIMGAWQTGSIPSGSPTPR